MAGTSLLGNITGWFKTPVHNYKVSTELFGLLNQKTIAKELNLEKSGQENGSNELPTTNSQIPDDVESKIQEEIDRTKNISHHVAEDELEAYNNRISNLNFERVFSEIHSLTPETISNFKQDVELSLNEMNVSRRNLFEIENEMNHFRKKNDLQNRTAKIPSKFFGIFSWLVIIIIFIAEVILNGSFLSKGNEGGLIGGIGLAIGFSFLNIVFSLIIANYGIRQIFHVNILRKLLGLISLGTYVGVIFTINLALAHYRNLSSQLAQVNFENYVEAVEKIQAEIINRLVNEPWNLLIEDWLLFGIGCLFSLLAAIDILNLYDSYPGYTSRQEKFNDFRNDYKEEFAQSVEELKQRKDEYREEVNNLLDALKDSQKELDSILLARDRLRSLYDSHFNHIQTVSNALHTIYFEANKKNRTSAAPKRFNNLPKISKPPLVVSNPEFTKRDLRTIQKKLSEVTTILKNGEQQIQKEFLDGIEKFNKLDKLDWQGWQEEEKRRR